MTSWPSRGCGTPTTATAATPGSRQQRVLDVLGEDRGAAGGDRRVARAPGSAARRRPSARPGRRRSRSRRRPGGTDRRPRPGSPSDRIRRADPHHTVAELHLGARERPQCAGYPTGGDERQFGGAVVLGARRCRGRRPGRRSGRAGRRRRPPRCAAERRGPSSSSRVASRSGTACAAVATAGSSTRWAPTARVCTAANRCSVACRGPVSSTRSSGPMPVRRGERRERRRPGRGGAQHRSGMAGGAGGDHHQKGVVGEVGRQGGARPGRVGDQHRTTGPGGTEHRGERVDQVRADRHGPVVAVRRCRRLVCWSNRRPVTTCRWLCRPLCRRPRRSGPRTAGRCGCGRLE